MRSNVLDPLSDSIAIRHPSDGPVHICPSFFLHSDRGSCCLQYPGTTSFEGRSDGCAEIRIVLCDAAYYMNKVSGVRTAETQTRKLGRVQGVNNLQLLPQVNDS